MDGTPPAPGPGARFEIWRAKPIPTAPEELVTYRREIVDIFTDMNAIGEEEGGDLALAQNLLQTTQTTLTQTQEDLGLLRDDYATLQDELQQSKATIKALNRVVLDTPENSLTRPAKTQELPTPPKFKGERSQLKAWKNSINIKLTGDAAKFPNNQHRLAYVYGLLDGEAKSQIEPYVLPTGINLADVAALTAILDRAFGDPDPVGTATRALRVLKQKNSTLSSYIAEFSRLAADVPWDAQAKLDHFQDGLSYEIKQALVYYEDVATLELLMAQASKVEQKLARLKNSARPPVTPSRTPAAPVNTPSHPSHTPGGLVPMDLSSGRPRLTQAERDRRRQAGECIICGKTGHFMADCPIRRPRPMNVSAAVPAPAPGIDQSGKEESLV